MRTPILFSLLYFTFVYSTPTSLRIPCSNSNTHCSSLGCASIDNTCSIEAGVAILSNLPQAQYKYEFKTSLRLTAGLNSDLKATGYENGVDFIVSQSHIQLRVNTPRHDALLDRIRIYGYPENIAIPRVIRFNGKLLRRGSLHYHRDSKSLELFDLKLPLNTNWELELLANDKAADQIECPVSYIKRNDNYDIPQAECLSPCVWDGIGCWLPSSTLYGYVVSGPITNTTFGVRIPLTKLGPSIYNEAINDIAVDIFNYNATSFRIKIYDPNNQRYEVPIALNLPTQPYTGPTDYIIQYPTILGTPFYVNVIRRSTGTSLFNTDIAGITFEDRLLSIAIRLPSRNLYGLGESYHKTFRREFDDSTWPVWARDQGLDTTKPINEYGTHPFYEVIEEDGNAHGILLYNSNNQEYQLQSGAPAVVWRTIGGILDFYGVTGPTPEDVIKQYTNIIGRSFLPPYWALGFQLSRYGYNNLANMQAAIQRTTETCQIPLDVFYGDIDTMDLRADFTIDPVNFAGLPQFVRDQRAIGRRYVPIIDPAIPNRPNYDTYTRGLQSNAYIKNENDSVLMGNVWPPEPVSFPDFFRSNTSAWWTDEITRFSQTIEFDGLWIDMNEPANFDTNVPNNNSYTLNCPVSPLDDPPYVPKSGVMGVVKRINDKTICMNTRQGDGNIYSHYDVHNLYGYSETIPTSIALQAVTEKRGLVFTRSSFVGSGILGGHWTGDNTAGWDHLQFSVIGLLDFNLFGLPYVGADICGYFNDAEEKLCERWQEVGAFYPFSRNHNTIGTIDQDPCIWPNTVGSSTRRAVLNRYRLLPYFYTIFYRANQGIDGTVIRSLIHQYPNDRAALGIDRQFLWGDALLVSPVLDIDVTTVNAYFPAGRWYDLYTGNITIDSVGEYRDLSAPRDYIPLHIKGGKIIPLQDPANTTTESRLNPHGLLVALNTDDGTATGDFFWDDGESIDTVKNGQYHYSRYNYADGILINTVIKNSTLLQNQFIETVSIHGITTAPTGIIGNVGPSASLSYDAISKIVIISDAHIPIDISFTVTLTFA